VAFGSKRTGAECRWSDVDWAACAEVLAACADSGALITLGRSRDGGAVSIGYVNGGKRDRDWASDPEEVPDLLHELHKILVGPMAPGDPASAPPAPDAPVARRRAQKAP
jgi:hypothetical protein